MSRASLAEHGQCVACYRYCNAYICEECCFDSDYVGARPFYDDPSPRVDQPTHVARMRRKRQEAQTAYEQMRDCWGALDPGVVPVDDIGRQAIGKSALPTGLGQMSRSARLRKMERDANAIDHKAIDEGVKRVVGVVRNEYGDAYNPQIRKAEARGWKRQVGAMLDNLGASFSSVGWALLDDLTRPG